ncbi:unnamed protein product [Merluccius merluccius]
MAREGYWCSGFLQHISVLLLSSMLHLNPSLAFSIPNCKILFSSNAMADIKVDCSNHKVTSVPGGIPRGVVWLNIGENVIQRIYKYDFGYFSNLTVLHIHQNQIAHIEDMSLVHLVGLRELYMQNNKLTKLSKHLFYGMLKLSVLDLSGNNILFISPFAFELTPSLCTVKLEANQLNRIANIVPVFQLPNIQEIHIGGNKLTSFESKDLPLNVTSPVMVLNLSSNPLDVFSITTGFFAYLEEIDLSDCGKDVMHVDIPDPSFLKSITHIHFGNTLMSFEGLSEFLESLESLAYLQLSNMERLMNSSLLETACRTLSLRTLDLRLNSLVSVGELPQCCQLTELDLSTNYISDLSSPSVQSMKRLRRLCLRDNHLSEVPVVVHSLSSLEILDLSFNDIDELGCSDFLNLTSLQELYLHDNHIKKLEGCVFQNQNDLKVLRLNKNMLLRLEGVFQTGLKKLEFLDITNNAMVSLYNREFKSLESLLHLETDTRPVERRVFEGLRNLQSLTVSLSPYMSSYGGLHELRTLTIYVMLDDYSDYNGTHANRFKRLMDYPSVRNLTLICKGFHFEMPFTFPIDPVRDMKSLQHFTTVNFYTEEPEFGIFDNAHHLKSLAIRSSFLKDMHPMHFEAMSNLEVLDLSVNTLKNLDFLAEANLTRLRRLILSQNGFTMLNSSVFEFLPALTYIDLSDNPLTCDCSNSGLMLWALSSKQTQFVNGYHQPCTYPLIVKGTMFLDFDLRSCWVNTNFLCYISTTSIVLFTLLASFSYHFLRWQLVYAYYLFMALLYDMKERKKNEPHRYDAFISYNVQDEVWVHRELLPALEDERGWRLCLHHRDFQPGRPIIENITEAIYSSRKTICVISRNYLESEWCSREIQMASYRLFDEKKDVLILLFLEELLDHQLSPYYRMRKLVKKSTYLSWPQDGQNTDLFWQNVHRALEKDQP